MRSADALTSCAETGRLVLLWLWIDIPTCLLFTPLSRSGACASVRTGEVHETSPVRRDPRFSASSGHDFLWLKWVLRYRSLSRVHCAMRGEACRDEGPASRREGKNRENTRRESRETRERRALQRSTDHPAGARCVRLFRRGRARTA